MEHLEAIVRLGQFLKEINTNNVPFYTEVYQKNKWFTVDFCQKATTALSENFCQEEKILEWCRSYSFPIKKSLEVGVVAAGNIPAVGFHDVLSVLISGHNLILKPSSQDILLLKLVEKLIQFDSKLASKIRIADKLTDAQAIIATGTDATARLLSYYFRGKPQILRKNRTSIAIIKGDETESELSALGNDIFNYFGLGCRNISKILVPKNYNWNLFYKSIENQQFIKDHNKYINNYDYQKSILLLNQTPHLDNGFLLIQSSKELFSPISILFYEEYSKIEECEHFIENHRNKIQCWVSKQGFFTNSLPFGQTQNPKLDDYPDGEDTLEYLLKWGNL